jgi:hypothetical protein
LITLHDIPQEVIHTPLWWDLDGNGSHNTAARHIGGSGREDVWFCEHYCSAYEIRPRHYYRDVPGRPASPNYDISPSYQCSYCSGGHCPTPP